MIHTQPFPNLYLIDLEQRMTGFRRFISSWLYLDEAFTFLVDPGPLNSIEQLIAVLQDLNVTHIDAILLTHIHIDHAGGTGRLLELYPDAQVNCHPRGIDHMIKPEKLWQGSLKVLGKIAEGYGEIVPVPADNISYRNVIDAGTDQIIVTETPGHAIHHVCYSFRGFLFAGEVAGVNHVLGNQIYARPATPPIFKLEVSLESLDKSIALDPEVICFGHFGFRKDPQAAMTTARQQLLLWTEIVREELDRGKDGLEDRVIARLKQRDAVFANLDLVDPDIREREDYFVRNTIRGMLGYVENSG